MCLQSTKNPEEGGTVDSSQLWKVRTSAEFQWTSTTEAVVVTKLAPGKLPGVVKICVSYMPPPSISPGSLGAIQSPSKCSPSQTTLYEIVEREWNNFNTNSHLGNERTQ